jgi:hypothetical protein
LALGSCLYNEYYAFAQSTTKLQAANSAVERSLNAVLDAEKAGANITSLLNQLNGATDFLSQAENAYRIGDYPTAVNDADAVLPIAQQVTTAAQIAKETASTSARTAFWDKILITEIAAIIFVLALLLVWRWVQRRYIKSLSDAKPEVISQ